jgi:hypothetical protein
MAIIRTNNQNQVAIWGETTFGTRPAPVAKAQKLPIIGHDIGRIQTVGKSRVIRGDPNLSQPPRGRHRLEGRKISLPIEKSMIGIPFYKMLPSYGVAGAADPYTHTFKLIGGAFHAAGRGVGFELWDAEASKGDVVDGCAIIGVEGEINTDDTEAMLTFEVAGIGKGTWNAGTREQAAPATFTDPFFNMADCRIKIDTVLSTLHVSARFAFRQKVSIRYVPDGNRFAAYLIVGGTDVCTVSLTALFDDTDAARILATGEAEHKVEFIFNHPTESATHNLSIMFPELMCYLTNVPAVGEGNEREVTVESTGYYQNGADATEILVTLKNALATYVGLMQ